ncbi:heterogeneous nuclear ribonucleoprotein 27C-like isoform X3 [Chironomus tepperi]|uniref:heterogeneous nuclear ribonucleoprotein 27C-like isoform X3 n=1 Tax=Chironomus tepperi TaxID=113505 RepID=UPI00391F7CF4
MRMNAGVDVEDDEKGKLFVGGLSWETTQDSLQRYFSRYGEVIDCVVMKNNETGRSRGFGFVTFADPNNVQVVLQSGPHNLDGRTIDPKQCNPRTMQKPKTRGGSYPKVFLGGLPSNVTETDLRMFFGRYGKVMEVVIMYDQEKKKSRGFGFLSFEDEASVERVTTEHYITLNGKQVEIKKAEPRDGSQNHKMNQDPINQSMNSNWGPPPSAQIGNPMTMQGPNSQMNAGPPMNMMAPNMMGGYPSTAGWGSQQQNYGYGGPSPANAYNQGWGPSPPQAAPQAPPPHQWSNYNATAQQTQGYGSAYDMYNSSNAAQTAAPGSGISGGNWNSWGPLTNSGASAGSSEYYEMYNRQSGSSAPTGMGPTGNAGNNTGKGPSADYSYGGYGNYTNDQPQSYGGPPTRSTYGNDIGQYPPTGDDYKRYLNQNIKQII